MFTRRSAPRVIGDCWIAGVVDYLIVGLGKMTKRRSVKQKQKENLIATTVAEEECAFKSTTQYHKNQTGKEEETRSFRLPIWATAFTCQKTSHFSPLFNISFCHNTAKRWERQES